MLWLKDIIFYITLCGLPTTRQADGRVEVDVAPATVRRVQFEAAHPSLDVPRMGPRESALTRYDFECSIHVQYEFTGPPEESPKGVRVNARLMRVEMRTTLVDMIYLPNDANVPLRSHEEGHWKIDQRVYERAESAARSAAASALDRTWPGAGDTADAAGKAATDAAVKAIGDAYLKATAGRASRVDDLYDEVTGHGTRPINVARAIDIAFEMDEVRQRAATRPSLHDSEAAP